ncbi:hypothetical protein TNCT_652921 [Trichonephila clavata]|uniref:Uncharacterized protein n=1 Tax=Trichonephila clavata TaxID=2740835 RepID=A0A8X6HNC8_TRICU|nr:hypothetical protein TNCT_652921 [Trichonephila clavata]
MRTSQRTVVPEQERVISDAPRKHLVHSTHPFLFYRVPFLVLNLRQHREGGGVKGSSHPLQSSCHDFGGGQFFCWQQPRPIHQVGRTMDNKQWPGEEGFSVAFSF